MDWQRFYCGHGADNRYLLGSPVLLLLPLRRPVGDQDLKSGFELPTPMQDEYDVL